MCLGVVSYFGVDVSIDSTFASGKTVDSVFALLWASANNYPQNTPLAAIKAVCVASGVGMTTYEAGPGLVENGVIGGGGATGAVGEQGFLVRVHVEKLYTAFR